MSARTSLVGSGGEGEHLVGGEFGWGEHGPVLGDERGHEPVVGGEVDVGCVGIGLDVFPTLRRVTIGRWRTPTGAADLDEALAWAGRAVVACERPGRAAAIPKSVNASLQCDVSIVGS